MHSPVRWSTAPPVRKVHGGPDSRLMAGGQTAEEVAEEIARMIADPSASVDAYSRPHYRQMIAAWCAWGGERGDEGTQELSWHCRRTTAATRVLRCSPVVQHAEHRHSAM